MLRWIVPTPFSFTIASSKRTHVQNLPPFCTTKLAGVAGKEVLSDCTHPPSRSAVQFQPEKPYGCQIKMAEASSGETSRVSKDGTSDTPVCILCLGMAGSGKTTFVQVGLRGVGR